jgi:hypothetical protein
MYRIKGRRNNPRNGGPGGGVIIPEMKVSNNPQRNKGGTWIVFGELLHCFLGIITVPGLFSRIVTTPLKSLGIITTPLICLGIITVPQQQSDH